MCQHLALLVPVLVPAAPSSNLVYWNQTSSRTGICLEKQLAYLHPILAFHPLISCYNIQYPSSVREALLFLSSRLYNWHIVSFQPPNNSRHIHTSPRSIQTASFLPPNLTLLPTFDILRSLPLTADLSTNSKFNSVLLPASCQRHLFADRYRDNPRQASTRITCILPSAPFFTVHYITSVLRNIEHRHIFTP